MDKRLVMLLVGIGSVVGGWVPSWFGASDLSMWGILGAAVGGAAGLYAAIRWLA